MMEVEAIRLFLASPQGLARARRALQRNRLPEHLRDDLVQEVLRRALSRVHQGEPIDNPAGFATAVLHHASVDLLRGRLRQPLPLPTLARDADDGDFDIESTNDPAVDDALVGSSLARHVRRALHAAAGTVPEKVAAALAYLTAAVDQAPVGEGCPQPAGGAGAREGAGWAGLWYAGRDDCFPEPSQPDSAAVRKRRSRAVAQFHAVLHAAAGEAGVSEAADDG